MCLHTVGKIRHSKGFGWKVFQVIRSTNSIITPCQGNCKLITIGEWIDQKDYSAYPSANFIYLPTPSRERYGTGFHVFKRKKDAVKYKNTLCGTIKIYKVEYRKAVAIGTQFVYNRQREREELPVVVAQEMKVIPNQKEIHDV